MAATFHLESHATRSTECSEDSCCNGRDDLYDPLKSLFLRHSLPPFLVVVWLVVVRIWVGITATGVTAASSIAAGVATLLGSAAVAAAALLSARAAIAVLGLPLCHGSGNGLQRSNGLLLAIDSHLHRVDDVTQLQGAGILESRTAEVVELCRVGLEANVDGLDDRVRVQTFHLCDAGHTGLLRHLGRRIERSETSELDGHTLCHELRQTVTDLGEHTLHDGTSIQRTVVYHVLCEAAQREAYENKDFAEKYDAEYRAGKSQPTASDRILPLSRGSQRGAEQGDDNEGHNADDNEGDNASNQTTPPSGHPIPEQSSPTRSLSYSGGEKDTDIYAQLPLDKWAGEIKEMEETFPCMKELFLNAHPHKLPAILFSSAALFGTLMTRAYYHFWYEPEIVRRLNYCIFIIGDPGAGKNVIEKFYFKIADPMIQADRGLVDAVNRYKDGKAERLTSTKAQKGEALKRPVVGIRVHPARTATGEFIRHMLAAVETIQGQPVNLHMFSFDSELDNVTKNNKGGDWKDREILELKAFHNEQDGQMYGNQDSLTGMFNVFWNFIYTGTPYALHRKVNQRNFGTGMSTRLAVIPLPDKGLAQRHQKVDPNANEALRTWAYRLDKVEGEIPIEPLNDETYDWQSSHLEIAEFNGDKADRTLLKRIPYYGIGVSLPYILMRHWDEWQESRSLTMDDTDKRLCRLAMEIQYKCQQFFFGEMAFNYFADQNKEFVVRRRTTRYDDCYRKLPDEFKTQQFKDSFSTSDAATSRAIKRLQNDGIIEKVSYGTYRKILQELP